MAFKSMFSPHAFERYPEGHYITTTCLKCARREDHELHDVPACGHTWMEPYKKPGISATFGQERICVLPRGHFGDHKPISESKIEVS